MTVMMKVLNVRCIASLSLVMYVLAKTKCLVESVKENIYNTLFSIWAKLPKRAPHLLPIVCFIHETYQ